MSCFRKRRTLPKVKCLHKDVQSCEKIIIPFGFVIYFVPSTSQFKKIESWIKQLPQQ